MTPQHRTISRRAFGLGAVGLTAALAGCSRAGGTGGAPAAPAVAVPLPTATRG